MPPVLPTTRVERVALAVFIGFLIAVVYHHSQIVRDNFHLHSGTTYLGRPLDTSDALMYYDQCRSLNPYLSIPPTYTRPYPPFGYLIGYPLTLLSRTASFALSCCLSILGGLWFLDHHVSRGPEADRRVWVLVTFLVSYPLLCVLDHGNPEMLHDANLLRFSDRLRAATDPVSP